MRKSIIFLVILLMCGISASAKITEESYQTQLDSNTAFYEGDTCTYIMPSPDNFYMNTGDAIIDGYSFAFVPEKENYSDASMLIGVNIFKIRGMTFEDAVKNDTASIREHFGKALEILPVDSVFNANGEKLTSFYLNDPNSFIPNVMISYYNGETELIIFELVITDHIPRFTAEDIFVNCIFHFKTHVKRELGYNE